MPSKSPSDFSQMDAYDCTMYRSRVAVALSHAAIKPSCPTPVDAPIALIPTLLSFLSSLLLLSKWQPSTTIVLERSYLLSKPDSSAPSAGPRCVEFICLSGLQVLPVSSHPLDTDTGHLVLFRVLTYISEGSASTQGLIETNAQNLPCRAQPRVQIVYDRPDVRAQ